MTPTNKKCVRGAKGLAEALSISLSMAEGIIRRREIPIVKLGTAVLIEVTEIDAFVERLKERSAAGAA